MPKQIKNIANKLNHSLYLLCTKAIEKIIIHKEQNNLIEIPYQYLPVKEIDYLMETFKYDWQKLQYFNNYEWRSEDFVNFINEELTTLPEFEDAAKQVISHYDIEEDIVKKFYLFSLLRKIMKDAPNGNASNKNIYKHIQLLVNDFESNCNHKPILWNINLWLNNFFIDSNEIKIAPNTFLKRPTKEQLADIKPKVNYIPELSRWTGRRLQAGAILSFSIEAKKKSASGLYPEIVVSQIEKWLNVFRLFKPTDTTVVYQHIYPDSIVEHGISENKEKTHDKNWQGKIEHMDISSYKLHLRKEEEEEEIINFVQNFESKISSLLHTAYLKGNSYELALHRYNDSLLKTEVNAYKVLSSVTSFEALLSDGKTEITFKIRMRTAKLLSYLGFNALVVSNKMRDAYNLRSKLVHGAKLKDGKKDLLQFAREHTHEILNFNRICLLVTLQLNPIVNKEKLIKLIDDSFIDKSSDENLKKLIDDHINIPILNPFKSRQSN